MATPSANIVETAVAGKYSRLFVSNSSAAMFPINANEFKFPIKTTDIDTTGYEDFGFGNGLTGIVRMEGMSFNCPMQWQRTGGGLGNAVALLTAGRFFVYEGWFIHPDFSALFGSLARLTGVAQVIDQPYESEVNGKPMLNVTASSRGAIYLPGVTAPSQSQMLSLFLNAPT